MGAVLGWFGEWRRRLASGRCGAAGGRGGEKRGRELASLIPYEVVYPFDQELANILGLRLRPHLGAIRFPDREPETCPCREWFEGILRC